jgi:hypothetical protein
MPCRRAAMLASSMAEAKTQEDSPVTDASVTLTVGLHPALCAGCRHFRPAGGIILSAEPACGAPRTAAGSDFESYFASRRLLLRARNSATCEFRMEDVSPA